MKRRSTAPTKGFSAKSRALQAKPSVLAAAGRPQPSPRLVIESSMISNAVMTYYQVRDSRA